MRVLVVGRVIVVAHVPRFVDGLPRLLTVGSPTRGVLHEGEVGPPPYAFLHDTAKTNKNFPPFCNVAPLLNQGSF